MSDIKLDWALFEKAAAAVKQAAPPEGPRSSDPKRDAELRTITERIQRMVNPDPGPLVEPRQGTNQNLSMGRLAPPIGGHPHRFPERQITGKYRRFDPEGVPHQDAFPDRPHDHRPRGREALAADTPTGWQHATAAEEADWPTQAMDLHGRGPTKRRPWFKANKDWPQPAHPSQVDYNRLRRGLSLSTEPFGSDDTWRRYEEEFPGRGRYVSPRKFELDQHARRRAVASRIRALKRLFSPAAGGDPGRVDAFPRGPNP
jgi:hypothetical protein